jgi:hypothetical protein
VDWTRYNPLCTPENATGVLKNDSITFDESMFQNRDIKVDVKFLKYVAKIKHLGATNQNYIHEEIKSSVVMESIQYRAIHLLLSYLKVYRTIILLVDLYGSETWTVSLRQESATSGLRAPCGPITFSANEELLYKFIYIT